ncbi:MAG: DUF1109 domain-containing protein [Rhodocyclaceae bacterium]|nr:DUF1109 domain-containing protein [Rhodocyclaceae bacterium]
MTKDLEQLVAELAAEAARVAPAPHPYRLGLQLIGAAAAYLAAALALSGVRADWAQALAQPWFVAEIAALLLLCVTTSCSAALLAFPDLHQKRALAFAPLWAFALFLLVMLCAWRADSPPAPLPAHSFECTLSITLLALLPAAWTFRWLRRCASTHQRWAGSVAVLSAFSVGALWLRLHEVNDSIVHVVAWHYLPLLAFAVVGLWSGRRLLKW